MSSDALGDLIIGLFRPSTCLQWRQQIGTRHWIRKHLNRDAGLIELLQTALGITHRDGHLLKEGPMTIRSVARQIASINDGFFRQATREFGENNVLLDSHDAGQYCSFVVHDSSRPCGVEQALFGETMSQKLPDRLKCLTGGLEASNAPEKSMNHAVPHIKTGIHSRRDCALNQPDGVIEEHFVVAYMNPYGRKALQVSKERRSDRVFTLVADQVGFNQPGRLRLCKQRISLRTA